MFDLSTRDTKSAAERGIVIHLEDPESGEKLMDGDQAVTITILGVDAGKVRSRTRETVDRAFDRTRKNKSRTADEAERDLFVKLAAATIAWNGIALDGAALECTEQNALKLYSDPRFPWIADQLTPVMMDRARFFSKGSPS